MTRIIISLILLNLGCSHAQAEDRYSGVTLIRGTVVSVGRVDPTENIGSGFFVDANYSSVALNAGVGTKKFGDSPIRRDSGDDDLSPADGERVTNAYAGVGFGRIIQVQYGYGTEGDVLRFRSDFNYRSVIDFFTGKRTPKDRLTLGDRLTFSIAVEQYQDDKDDIFDNATWGIGLLF